VRLVVYEGVTEPDAAVQRKTLAGSAARCTKGRCRQRDREGARTLQAFPCAVRHHAGAAAVVLATAACRDARNGKDFIAQRADCRTKIDVIPASEAELTALAWSPLPSPRRHRRRLGGGSLELSMSRQRIKPAPRCRSALALQTAPPLDEEAEKIVKDAFDDLKLLRAARAGRSKRSAALGGRSLTAHGADGLSASLHARLRHPRQGGAGVSRLVRRVHPDTLSRSKCESARRALLPYAAGMEHIVRERSARGGSRRSACAGCSIRARCEDARRTRCAAARE